jgi:hypothetical protein
MFIIEMDGGDETHDGSCVWRLRFAALEASVVVLLWHMDCQKYRSFYLKNRNITMERNQNEFW